METQNTLLYTVKLSKIKGWGKRPPVYYPIWWGIAAWPVDTFVENNDFTGKTVIPFCTSGDWQEGMRFRSGADEADVQEWVNGLGL